MMQTNTAMALLSKSNYGPLCPLALTVKATIHNKETLYSILLDFIGKIALAWIYSQIHLFSKPVVRIFKME